MKIITKQEAIEQGLDYYYTGKPCKNGHLSSRWLSGNCKECARVSQAAYKKKLRKEDPERYTQQRKVHRAVRRAIKNGTLIPQPCEVCGGEKVEAHHEDYNKRFDVMWLCRKHHIEKHQTEKGE